LAVAFGIILSTVVTVGAQTVPVITVVNDKDSWLEIVPLDQAHHGSIPQTIDNLLPELPPGSFLLRNFTAISVNVIVAKWSYRDQTGSTQQKKIYCDAYLASPVEPLVKPHELSLVTPGGCTRQEYFGSLKTGSFLGSPLGSPHNKSILNSKDSIAEVEISVDSAIFENGQIWGPDQLRYYATIMQRHAAAQSVVEELIAAKKAGEDLSTRLQKIQSDAHNKKDQFSWFRADQAGMIERSPNPEGTLRWLQQQSPLPEFQHIGGNK
jgi:hypothetical protein